MNKIKSIYFLFPLVLAVVLLTSNLISAKLFLNSNHHFVIWFVFLIISFGIGFIMHSGFKWKPGVKIILSTIAGSVIVSLLLVAMFKNRFDVDNSLIDNLIHYSLRVFVIGIFSIFGLAIAEISKNKNITNENKDSESYDSSSDNKESEYYINEAKLKAEKIIFEAEKDAQSINERKTKIEMQLRELIQTEREVIRNYEKEKETSDDNNIE